MIFYLDASALVKRYVAEAGSLEVGAAISQAALTGTALISRAEVVAGLARAVRVSALTREEALAALQVFRSEWADLVRIQVTEIVVARADALAWDHGLRGYDAVQLAAALRVQSAFSPTKSAIMTFVTADTRLITVAQAEGATVDNPNNHL